MIKRRPLYIFWPFSSFILLMTLFPIPFFSQGDAIIMPGVGVGVLRLNERVDDILKKIGPVDVKQWRKATGQNNEEIMWLSLEELGMSLAFDFNTKMLKRILVLTKALLVQNSGLRIGSSFEEVVKLLGIDQINEQKDILSLDYSSLGIKFYIDRKTRKVRTIEVYERPIREIRDHRSHLRF